MTRRFFFMLSFMAAAQLHAQTVDADQQPLFEVPAAREYLQKVVDTDPVWKQEKDSVRVALVRLLEHTSIPYDTIREQLLRTDFSNIQVARVGIPVYDSLRIRWLNDSTFIIDTVGWNMTLFFKEELQIRPPVDFSDLTLTDTLPGGRRQMDSLLSVADNIMLRNIDTAAIRSLGIPLHRYTDGRIVPPVSDPGRHRSVLITPDSAQLVLSDSIYIWMADQTSPFYRLTGPHQLDSLEAAMHTLIGYNLRRDSTELVINDIFGSRVPFWVTTGRSSSQRFWVKNYRNDSITLWIGNPAGNEISLLLEEDIDVNRLVKEERDHLPVVLEEPERELAEISLLKPKSTIWEYDFSSAFTFNQTYLSNWTKGGESSLASNLDMTGSAIYSNKEANYQWISSARINIGTLFTDEKGLRKNNDLFEINSKFNRNASGKIGLSASFYMKNQLAKGYNYPNDSVVVSKFLNPGSLTIGLGAEYKPFKNTTINMAPLSYKNTFVLDTALIDQTKHGISASRRAKQELGTQILLINQVKPMDDLTVSNKLRLFSNYLDHPENIDVDWEMILDKKINWFFTIRLNLHLIYDDNVRFTVFDEDEQPVLLPDGSQKKVARTQFKEFIGLSLLFRF